MKHQVNPRALRWMWQVSGKEKRNIAFLILVQGVLGISSVIFAWTLRNLIDNAVGRNFTGFDCCAGSLVGIVLVQIAFRAAKRFLDEYTKSGMENRFKERLFSALLTRDYASVTAVHSGEWLNRLTSDTVVVADGLTTIIPDIAGMGVRLLGALGAILILIPELGYALIPCGILLLVTSYSFRRILKKLHRGIQEADGKLRVLLSEHLSGLLIVRSFVREEQTVCDAAEQMQAHRKARMKRNHFSNICNIGFAVAMNGVYMFGVIYCGYGILTGTMSYGSFIAVLQLIGQVQSPFANITGYLPKFYAMLSSAERLMEAENYALARQSEVLDMERIKAFYEEDFAAMGLWNATFTYIQPTQQGEDRAAQRPVVFQNITLEIHKGDYVAITGHSGCGKSTILKLLMSLYHLDAGTCYVMQADGTQKRLDAAFTRLFAYVPQGNQLMSGSIREMVAFSDKEKMCDDKAIQQALQIACAMEFVQTLPDGIDTLLGERGTGLSEGQMQRIAIARAIFSGNPVLILDESTSALDDDTEQKLLNNLRTMTDKTVLIVTHRPALLGICNRQIIMRENGLEVKELQNK